MGDRKEQFTAFTNLKFSELDKIKFKWGHEYRNATDYYYHGETNIIYAYYWGGSPGYWKS